MAVLTQLQLDGSSTVYDLNDARISSTSVSTATHFLGTNSSVSAINPISASDLASVLGVVSPVVYLQNQTDATVATLVSLIGNDVLSKANGLYIYNGGWYTHSNGYNAIVIKHPYNNANGGLRVSGIIFEYAGNVYSFTRLYDGTIKVSPSITTMV